MAHRPAPSRNCREYRTVQFCSDINSHPSVRLLSMHPVWLHKPASDATAASEWIDAWFNITVANQSIVTDPSICPPGFNLPRRLWSTLNRFRTGQGRCAANLVRWHQASDPSCICGNPRQTMNHIVNHCPITRLSGGLRLLHQADEDAVSWLNTQSKQ